MAARHNLIGRAITVSDQRVEVVGIAPAGFRFEDKVEIWLLGDRGIPRFSSIGNLQQNRDVHMLTAVGRLREDASLSEAQAELDVIAARLAREYPKTNKGWGTALDPLQSALVGHTRRMLMLLLGAVALMLLIASVNVANLMLVRTKAREVELAMRSALGASPGRVIRQLLAESARSGGVRRRSRPGAGRLGCERAGAARARRIAPTRRDCRQRADCGVCRRCDGTCDLGIRFVAGVACIARAS